jgi:predicted nucleotidyltransferase
MTRIDPLVAVVLADIARGLRALKIDFCVIGALVPELLLGVAPRRLTNDADATVVLHSLADFEQLKEQLAEFGFNPTRVPYRLDHREGGWVDLLPYSKTLAPSGQLDLTRDLSFNMAGFDQVVPNAVQVLVKPGLTVPMAPLPLYVLLKLVAYGDRKEPKKPRWPFEPLNGSRIQRRSRRRARRSRESYWISFAVRHEPKTEKHLKRSGYRSADLPSCDL